MLHPSIFNTSEICYRMGVRHAVMSPGSRNAPLTLSFARHEKVEKFIVPDERTAGFIALGIAQQRNEPVVLCCTSGTAVLNYYPAIAEAYYREIPLIVLSADRPPELIDQRDGQTIRQYEVLKNHIKNSYQLPIIKSSADAATYEQLLETGLRNAARQPLGPVHFNIPFSEPFYPTDNQDLKSSYFHYKKESFDEVLDMTTPFATPHLPYTKVLIVIGQHGPDPALSKLLARTATKVPVVRSPLNNLSVGIDHVDAFIGDDALQPELLITSGLSVLSKKLKQFLRNARLKKHLHFDPAGVPVDTYQSNPQLIKSDIKAFLEANDFEQADATYLEQWQQSSRRASEAMRNFLKEGAFSEVTTLAEVLKSTPASCVLHLSNSMPVRYAELLGVKANTVTYCNRGTSGIDGSTSTAVGAALVSSQLHLLVTGDLAFFYDRNAFFHNYPLKNFRVVVSNNTGGGIFRLIEGPSKLPELEEYFETRHHKTAKHLCEENDIEYLPASNEEELQHALREFFEDSDVPKLIEVFTDPQTNQHTFKELKHRINEQINH